MNCGACYKTSTLADIAAAGNKCPYCGNACDGAKDILEFFDEWLRRYK